MSPEKSCTQALDWTETSIRSMMEASSCTIRLSVKRLCCRHAPHVNSIFVSHSTGGGRKGDNWHSHAIAEAASKQTQKRFLLVDIPSKKCTNHSCVLQMLNSTDLTCLWGHCGCAISVSRLADDTSINSIQKYLFVEYQKIFVNQIEGNCLTSAITPSLYLVARREVANALKDHFFEEGPQFLKICRASSASRSRNWCGDEKSATQRRSRRTLWRTC